MKLRTCLAIAAPVALLAFVACGGGERTAGLSFGTPTAAQRVPPGGDDQSRCDFKGRADREVSESAGPGSVTPNVRRVFQLVGTGDDRHKVLVCREADTNLDGLKDTVRYYNEKGEALREESDTNFDGKIDDWTIFAQGRISKETFDRDFDGQPDEWKFFVGGQLSRVQRDTNRDGKPDRWEFYANGALERIGVDLDFDGHVDRWDHDEVARQQAEAAAKAQQKADAGAPATASTAAPASPDEASADSDAGPKLVSKAKRTLKDAGAKD